MSLYEYQAEATRVVDGDTVHADVDLGFDIHARMKLRLSGINAPELTTEAGKAARQHLVALIDASLDPLRIHTEKDRTEKFGRYLARLVRSDGVDINAQMIADGFAVAYDGGKR